MAAALILPSFEGRDDPDAFLKKVEHAAVREISAAGTECTADAAVVDVSPCAFSIEKRGGNIPFRVNCPPNRSTHRLGAKSPLAPSALSESCIPIMSQLFFYIREGGVIMWPLLGCSLLSVAVIIERAVRLRRRVLIDPAIVDDIQRHIEQGKMEVAIRRHKHSPVLIGRILSEGLEEYASTSADIETSLIEAGERGLPVLFNNLAVLGLVAKVAPLLGLLGTVLGMIMGFEELEQAGVGKENLAHAIRVALFTTAAGLIIAIPTVVANAYFRSGIRRVTAEFEEIFIDIIKTVKATGKAGASEPAPAKA